MSAVPRGLEVARLREQRRGTHEVAVSVNDDGGAAQSRHVVSVR